jgi:hypothetical protein
VAVAVAAGRLPSLIRLLCKRFKILWVALKGYRSDHITRIQGSELPI